MQNKHIGPHDRLENGTKVRVGQRYGVVVRSDEVQAIPTGNIIVHTIRFTHRITRYPAKRVLPMKTEIEQDVNYSGIVVINQQG